MTLRLRPGQASTVAAVLGVVAVAVAIWLIPASVHIVDWPDSGPHSEESLSASIPLLR